MFSIGGFTFVHGGLAFPHLTKTPLIIVIHIRFGGLGVLFGWANPTSGFRGVDSTTPLVVHLWLKAR